MLLAVDVGNTNVVFGVHDGDRWLHQWRVRTVREKMPDEYAVLFRGFTREAGLSMDGFDQVVLSSVVPPLTGKMEEMLVAQTGSAPLVVSYRVRTGLSFAGIPNPAEVGADLIADAVAAYTRYAGAAIVVDFGTATTFVAVSGVGEFRGVAITPGLNLAMGALAGGAAQLPHIHLAPPPQAIGTNTIEAIQSGIILGYVGLVEGLIDRFQEELGGEAHVVATGGLARLVAPLTDRFADVDLWLTLDGVRLIGLQNR